MSETRPIRILHIMGAMNRAGAETLLMHYLRCVNRNEFRMDVMVHTSQLCAYDDEIRALGSKLIPCVDPSRIWTYGHGVRRILREHGPYDIVHSHVHYFSGLVLRIARGAGVRVRVAHSHNDHAALLKAAGRLRRLYVRTAKQWIDRCATHGIAVSDLAGRDLFGPEWQSDPRWMLLPTCIDLDPLRARVDQASVRVELGLPQDAFVVGHVGRFEEQKNHSYLVDIASELVRLEPRTHLLLIGEGPLRPLIERRLFEAGLADRAVFAGSRPDVPRLMLGAMDAFLFPSLHEGLPLTLIEAQAAGLPCVISDAIARESDIVGPLITRLRLSQPSWEWAEAVAAFSEPSAVPVAREQALEMVEKTPMNIRVNVKQLERFYREACRG